MYDVSLLMKANSRIQKRRPILQDGHFIFVSDEPFFDEYDLIECLNSMRKDFLYFQYADTPFFDGLKDKLQGLEDYLILAEEHPLAEEKAMSFLHHVDSSLLHIYEDVVAHF